MIRIQIPATSANLGSGFDSLGIALTMYNQVWMELSQQYGCPYLNVAEALTDENGCLPEEMT